MPGSSFLPKFIGEKGQGEGEGKGQTEREEEEREGERRKERRREAKRKESGCPGPQNSTPIHNKSAPHC
jgi:hypothetical protein